MGGVGRTIRDEGKTCQGVTEDGGGGGGEI